MVQQLETIDKDSEDQLDREYQAAIELLLSRAAAAGEHDMAPIKSAGKPPRHEVERESSAVEELQPAALEEPKEDLQGSTRSDPRAERQTRLVETASQLKALRRVAKVVAASSVNTHLLRRRKKVKRELVFAGLLAFLATLALAVCLLTPGSPVSRPGAVKLGLAIVSLCLLTVVHCVSVIRNLEKSMLPAPDPSEACEGEADQPASG